MQENFDLKGLMELLDITQLRLLKEKLIEMNEADIATFIEELDSEKIVVVYRMFPKELAGDVFVCLSAEKREHTINSITDYELSAIISDLFMDDVVNTLEELPVNVVRRVLKNSMPDTRKLINQLLKYPEGSAGSIMTAEYVGLGKRMIVEETFAYIRRRGVDKETIYTCYVMDAERALEGVVAAKDLLMHPYEEVIGNIMDSHVIRAVTTDDQEEVTESFRKYDLLSLPVVDHENRLVGIATVDDVVDVMEQEAIKGSEKMTTMLPNEKFYLKIGVLALAKNCLTWSLILMVSSMITGSILAKYEAAFAVIPLLVTFILTLTDIGSNAGSQSSTMIIRGMTMGEIEAGDILRVFWKKLWVGVIVGVPLGLVNYIQLVIRFLGQKMLYFTVVLSLLATVMLTKIIGCVLSIAAQVLYLGPAIMAAPLIATTVDAVSLIIYFQLVCSLLKV